MGQCLCGEFFKTLKAEADKVEGRHTKEEVRVEVCEYMEPYYNKRRRHSALGLCYTDSINTLRRRLIYRPSYRGKSRHGANTACDTARAVPGIQPSFMR
ncbi:MAG: hypothetical protein LBB61_02080 [Treponema sp.]|nr:hypothetical protein [Treponema sp.]